VFGRDPSPTTATLPLWISSGLGLLAGKLGVGFATVARIWHGWNLQPWRVETFKFSTDPQLEAKVRDVVGLCLHPPENAVVLCLDEKSPVQALQRTAPILPIMPGVPEKATHDYIRNGIPWWLDCRQSTAVRRYGPSLSFPQTRMASHESSGVPRVG
jgi:hypothetical protein